MLVREELEKLFKLQEFDLQVQRARKSLLFLHKQIKPLKQEIESLEVEIAAQDVLKNDFEKKILDRVNANASDKIYADGMEEKLGSISAHKEYHYTAKTIDKLRKLGRDRSVEIESYQNHLNEIQTFIDSKTEEKNNLEAQLKEKATSFEALTKLTTQEIEDTQTARELFRPNIAPSILFKYESLVKAYGYGLGVVKDARCQSCDVILPPQIYNLLRRAEDVLQCPNCQRLLYLKIQ